MGVCSRRTEESILTELNTTRQLLGCVYVALSFFGHTIRDDGCELEKCVIQGKVGGKGRRGRPKTSYSSNITNGCLKAWSESRGTHGIALNGEVWYDVRHGRLIITPGGTVKGEDA